MGIAYYTIQQLLTLHKNWIHMYDTNNTVLYYNISKHQTNIVLPPNTLNNHDGSLLKSSVKLLLYVLFWLSIATILSYKELL